MNASRHFAVAVILPVVCATVAVPQTVTFSSRQDGNLVSAGTSVTGPNYNANLNLSPYISEQGAEGYIVNWSTAIYGGLIPAAPVCVSPTTPPPPLPPLIAATNITGIVPRGAIKLSPARELSVDLEIPRLQTVLNASSIDCSAGPCTMSRPVSFPVKGAFNRMVSGIGASTFTNNGNRDIVNVDPLCTITSSFNGNDSGGTANFVGTIGMIAIAAPPLGANGSIHVQKGQQRFTSVCTPAPPPI